MGVGPMEWARFVGAQLSADMAQPCQWSMVGAAIGRPPRASIIRPDKVWPPYRFDNLPMTMDATRGLPVGKISPD